MDGRRHSFRRIGGSRRPVAVLMILSLLLLGGWTAPLGAGQGASPLPDAGAAFVVSLGVPSVTAGAATRLSFELQNPLSVNVTDVRFTVDLYAFNAFPGNLTSPSPPLGAPLLSNSTSSGAIVSQAWPAWGPRSHWSGGFALTSSSTTPIGTYAIRTRLTFELNGSVDTLESRGWFTSAQWASATENHNGSATLNLTRLGVAGVIPETAVQIRGPGIGGVLIGLIVAAFLLAGAGAYLYFRRGPGSSSGVDTGSAASHAPRAFGSRRRSEGDSRNN